MIKIKKEKTLKEKDIKRKRKSKSSIIYLFILYDL